MPSSTALAIILRVKDEASSALKRIGANVSGFGNTVRSALKTAAIGATALVAAVGGLTAGVAAIYDAVGGLEQLDRKAQAVFGDTLPTVQAWADANAHAMGLTRTEAIAAAAGLQDLLIPMGFTREAATAMTTETIGLSGALAEWSGGQYDAAEVSQILAKAMLGEREQLKSLGISITEADVQTRLAAKGQEELTGAALQQAKAIATQELIFEKSADAQAAFKSGGDSLYRTQQELKAAIGETKESVLRALAPAMREVADLVRTEVLPRVVSLSEWLSAKIPVALEAARDGFNRARPFLESFISGLQGIWAAAKQAFEFIVNNKPVLIAVVGAIGLAIAAALGPGGLAIVAIVALITLIGKLRDDWQGVAIVVLQAVQKLANGIIDGMNNMLEAVTNLIEFGLNPLLKLAEFFGQGPGAIDFGGEFIGQVDFSGQIASLQAQRDARDLAAEAAKAAKEQEEALAAAREQVTAESDDLALTESALASAHGAAADAAGKSKQATEELTDAQKRQQELQERFFDVIGRIQQDFLDQQVEAYLQGGQEQVDIVTRQQDEMMANANKIAAELRRTFGLDLPTALEYAMAHLTKTAQNLAAAAAEAAKKSAEAVGANVRGLVDEFGIDALTAGGFGFNIDVPGLGFGIGGAALSLQDAFDSVSRAIVERGGALTDAVMTQIVSELERQQSGALSAFAGEAVAGGVVNVTINAEGSILSEQDVKDLAVQGVAEARATGLGV